MKLAEQVFETIEEEREMLPSDGSKIGYAIDHFGLPFEDIYECAKQTELSCVTVVELLIDTEKQGKSPQEAVEFLKAYSRECADAAEEDKLRKYLSTSCLGYMGEFENAIESIKNRKLISTGFPNVDKALDGGLSDGLYVVGAIPSLGKTTLIMQIADCVAMQGQDVLIFSLEMSRVELMAKSISRLTIHQRNVLKMGNEVLKTSRQILDGRRYERYTDSDKKVIAFAKSEYMKFAQHIFVVEGVGDIGISGIRKRVEEHIEMTGNTPIVVIDYVQILAPLDVRASDKQNIDKAALEMKRISRDFMTSVIGISSFNRSNYKAKAEFSAFKESGALEYGADVVIGLNLEGAGEEGFDATVEKNKSPRRIEAVILKNRNGRTGDTILFEYFPQFNYFADKGVKKYE